MIHVINNDWQTKNIQIKDLTMRTLKDGRKVPTELNSFRKAAKI